MTAEARSAYMKVWRERTKTQRSEYQKQYRERNAEHVREQNRLYMRQYSADNRERVAIRVAEWKRRFPDKVAVQKHRRRTRKYKAGGEYTAQQWADLKSLYSHQCLCCRRVEPDIRLTVDHVVPLVLGGPNHISNIQPLCKPCNSKKGTRIIDYRLGESHDERHNTRAVL